MTNHLTKRIIPCLDIRDGRTVKGIKFEDIRDAGDPVALGERYAKEGADELVFLDITATKENRDTFASLVSDIASHLNIPFTVGGGIRNEKDVEVLLRAGADKVSINSSAVINPGLINRLAAGFGSQCIVVAVDAKNEEGSWFVHTHGGSKRTEKHLHQWTLEAQDRGAGEILFTSMDHDGTKKGFALEAIATLTSSLSIPVIASGGGGKKEHFSEVFQGANADAALAASIFHFSDISIPDLKLFLRRKDIEVRI